MLGRRKAYLNELIAMPGRIPISGSRRGRAAPTDLRLPGDFDMNGRRAQPPMQLLQPVRWDPSRS